MNRREVQLFLAGQALSRIYTPKITTLREKSGLEGVPSHADHETAIAGTGAAGALEGPSSEETDGLRGSDLSSSESSAGTAGRPEGLPTLTARDHASVSGPPTESEHATMTEDDWYQYLADKHEAEELAQQERERIRASLDNGPDWSRPSASHAAVDGDRPRRRRFEPDYLAPPGGDPFAA